MSWLFLKLNPLQNHGIIKLQDHRLNDSAVSYIRGIAVNSFLCVEKVRSFVYKILSEPWNKQISITHCFTIQYAMRVKAQFQSQWE